MYNETEQKSISRYVKEGLIAGAITSFLCPLEAAVVFSHTKDVNPYLLRTGLKLSSPLDLFSYFNNRDGSYKLWSCYWSGLLVFSCQAQAAGAKRYFFEEVFNFKSSSVLDPVTKKPRKVSAKEAVRFFFAHFGVEAVTSILRAPVHTLIIKMVADYEPVPQFDNIIDCLCKTVEKEGLAGLFRPLPYQLLYVFVDSAFTALMFSMNYRTLIDEGAPEDGVLRKKTDWLHYGLRALKLGLAYPIDRLWYRAAVVPEGDLTRGLWSYSGFWLDSLPDLIEFSLFVWNSTLKSAL